MGSLFIAVHPLTPGGSGWRRLAELVGAVYPVKHVSWSEVVDWSRRLAAKIASSGFRPDVVVAVGRGGYVVSRLLCDFLGVDRLAALPIRWRERVRRAGEGYLADLIRCFARGGDVGGCIANVVRNLEIEVAPRVDVELDGLRALAVEEITATGLHLAKAKEVILTRWRAGEARTASLIWKSSTSTLRPDYLLIETPGFVWFQFPWSRTSDYQQMALVAIETSCADTGRCTWGLDEVAKLFERWYGFLPDPDYLRLSLERLADLGIVERIGDNLFRLRHTER